LLKVNTMKYILIFTLLFLWTNLLLGQKRSINNDSCIAEYNSLTNRTIYQRVDLMPEFPGGIDSLIVFIETNLKWPKENRADFCGRFFISVIVETDGSLTTKKITRGIYESADNEALILIDKMPKWKAGKCKGVAVPVKMLIPVNFKLY
jgi:hypothetical protein